MDNVSFNPLPNSNSNSTQNPQRSLNKTDTTIQGLQKNNILGSQRSPPPFLKIEPVFIEPVSKLLTALAWGKIESSGPSDFWKKMELSFDFPDPVPLLKELIKRDITEISDTITNCSIGFSHIVYALAKSPPQLIKEHEDVRKWIIGSFGTFLKTNLLSKDIEHGNVSALLEEILNGGTDKYPELGIFMIRCLSPVCERQQKWLSDEFDAVQKRDAVLSLPLVYDNMETEHVKIDFCIYKLFFFSQPSSLFSCEKKADGVKIVQFFRSLYTNQTPEREEDLFKYASIASQLKFQKRLTNYVSELCKLTWKDQTQDLFLQHHTAFTDPDSSHVQLVLPLVNKFSESLDRQLPSTVFNKLEGKPNLAFFYLSYLKSSKRAEESKELYLKIYKTLSPELKTKLDKTISNVTEIKK